MDKTVKTASSMSSNSNDLGRTALHSACGMGSSVTARSLVEAGADVNAVDQDGRTPLLIAAVAGFADCVQLLLDNGANPNAATNNIGNTALISAAYEGHIECLRVLLNHGASVNAKTKGGLTALIAAANSAAGHSKGCIEVLLQAGGEINAKTNEGTTALIHAVTNNCGEAVEVLLDGGSELNASDGKGYTALHYGALHNSVECIQILLDRGADETRKFPPGHSPLEMAPRGSEGALLLGESWKKLELLTAMRAEELLHQEHQSNTQTRKKKNGKKKKKKQHEEAVEKPDEGIQVDGKQTVTGDSPNSPKTPQEVEAKAEEATEHEETLMERVKRLELELEQANQAVHEKVKELESLEEASSVRIQELAKSLSRAHHQAESAKTNMESRIHDLEAIVAHQTQALQISEVI